MQVAGERPTTGNANGSTSVTETLAMDFSNYGEPVAVTAPLAATVASFSQFDQAESAANATTGGG